MATYILYTVICFVFFAVAVLTLGYKKSIFRKINRKKHRLRFFYGTTAFYIDIVDRYIHRIHYSSEREKLGRISIEKPDNKEVYIHIVSQAVAAVLVFYVVLFAGYIKCTVNVFTKKELITDLVRPDAREGSRSYKLVMDYDGKSEMISIDVEPKRYTEDEAEELIIDNYERLTRVMLGDNESIDNIVDNLNLVNELGEGITVEWNLDDSGYIDPMGRINWNNIEGKYTTQVTAVMSVGEYSRNYTYNIVLNKAGRDKKKIVKEDIEVSIENAGTDSKTVSLRDIMDKYGVVFSKKKDKGSIVYIFIAMVIAGAIYYAKRIDTDRILDKRKEQLSMDYEPIISKLTILQGSGMTILGAWNKIIEDYERALTAGRLTAKRYAYEEMKIARNLMNSGYSEVSAYLEFGRRCGIHSYVKLGNLLEQNIRKGTKGLKEVLNAEVREAMEERKALARKKGDEAGTKLLFPMGIMLIISIIIIVVPAFMSMNI